MKGSVSDQRLKDDNEVIASRLREVFEENFRLRGEVGASLCVLRDAAVVVSLAGGYEDAAGARAWSQDSRVLWWSATKPLSAATMLLALYEAGIPFDSPVAGLWPEFAAGGKSGITFLDILSHRAGLAAIPGVLIDPYDHEAVAAALAAMTPLWPLHTGLHGYHARTLGYLAEEITRRATNGSTLKNYWRQNIALPAGLDFWIGVDDQLAGEVADSLPPAAMRIPAEEKDFFAALADPSSLTSLAFRSPSGDIRPRSMNTVRARTFGFPALGGIGTASAMARFYAILLAGGEMDGRRILPAAVCEALATRLSQSDDQVLRMPTAFSAGAMLDPVHAPTGRKLRETFGPVVAAFGHPGAGGCLAFADPLNRLAFAYCMNQMDTGVMPSTRAASLVRALYASSARSS